MNLHLTFLPLTAILFSFAWTAPLEIKINLGHKSATGNNIGNVQEWVKQMAVGGGKDQQNSLEMPAKERCPFRNAKLFNEWFASANAKYAKLRDGSQAEISDFADTFLFGEISYGKPPQKFNVIFDSTMFMSAGVPITFVIDANTCDVGKGQPCERMNKFDATKSSTFTKVFSLADYTLAKDIITLGEAQAEGKFLLLKGNGFDKLEVLYNVGAKNVPRIDGIFSMAFTHPFAVIKSGMEYLLEWQQLKVATVYIEPITALDFFKEQKASITVGGLNEQKCAPKWNWTPVPGLFEKRWTIPLSRIGYNNRLFKGGKAYFSTFHTFILGPKEAIAPLMELVKPLNQKIDDKDPMDVAVECDRSKLPNVDFYFGNSVYTLTPEQYVLDVVLDPEDTSKNICHMMIRPTPEKTMPDARALIGRDGWLFGQLFFNNFCVGFDYTPHGQKIGLALHV